MRPLTSHSKPPQAAGQINALRAKNNFPFNMGVKCKEQE